MHRILQDIWDVGYAWIRAETGSHPPAPPPQILLAMMSGLWYGAGFLLLDVWLWDLAFYQNDKEIFFLIRKHLFLPAGAIGFAEYTLISINDSKNIFLNARAQTVELL